MSVNKTVTKMKKRWLFSTGYSKQNLRLGVSLEKMEAQIVVPGKNIWFCFISIRGCVAAKIGGTYEYDVDVVAPM